MRTEIICSKPQPSIVRKELKESKNKALANGEGFVKKRGTMKFFKHRHKAASTQEMREFRERMSDEEITGKDRFAMVLSAMLIIVLPCLLILLGLGFLMLFLFGALG